MMRLIFKALVVVFLALGIGNYLVYLNTGKLPLSDLKAKFSLDALTTSTQQLLDDTKRATQGAVDKHISGDDSSSTTKIYKWTDENGVVHYGENPAGAGAQQLQIEDANLTILPATEVTEVAAKPTVESTRANPAAAIENAETPIEKARAAAEAMKAHNEMQSQY